MTYQPQHITAPDGTPLVVIRREDYEELLRLSEDARDTVDAGAIAARIEQEGTVPAAVVNAMLDDGLTPVQAWRKYRGFSQAELAHRAGLSQPFVAKIEKGEVYGRPATRKALAAALDAPVWSLDEE